MKLAPPEALAGQSATSSGAAQKQAAPPAQSSTPQWAARRLGKIPSRRWGFFAVGGCKACPTPGL